MRLSGASRGVSRHHHQRNVRSVDVRIEKTDLMPKFRQRHRQVDGNRGLPDPALAGTNGNDVLYPGQWLRCRRDPMRVSVSQNVFLFNDYSECGASGATGRTCPSDN